METNNLVATLLIVILGIGCLIILARLFLSIREQRARRLSQQGGTRAGAETDFLSGDLNDANNPNNSARPNYPEYANGDAYKQREREWEARWKERERQIDLQRSEQERHYQEQAGRYQKRIDQLESERLNLQAEKVRLETILEQHSGLQSQLLEQSKLNWEELSRKQQQEHTQHILQNLEPLQQQLQFFRQQLEQQHQDGIKNTAQLEQYLKHLQDDTRRLGDDARSLAEALKGDQRRQGAWGEMILARTLEQSGLREGVEYQLQKSFIGPDGGVFRPDAVIQFPGQRYIVIDSKVSLRAYEAFLSATDEEERQKQLKKHSESLAKHVKDLAGKEYQTLLGVQQSPDFVLLFCPIEGALAEALRHDNQLFEDGFRRHVVLVSPTLLLVVLRIIEQLWRYEKQRRNVADVYVQAGKVFDKLALFCDDMKKVEQQVNTLHKSVDHAMQRLSGGRQSLLRQVQKLQDLGADTVRELPDSMPDSAEAAKPGAG
ncbi:DNA recombination protein RmuC [Candidatus Haliotispira prima]|uniref:DNA recombination protein RmuC n=1 Tax=Candidatus Haliotispira prima TaxID=3034016 RepID=A0ABY8MH62_9SPIO|nr:DNA recombination protein RmuC [Candidatus Haliotispira prima]